MGYMMYCSPFDKTDLSWNLRILRLNEQGPREPHDSSRLRFTLRDGGCGQSGISRSEIESLSF